MAKLTLTNVTSGYGTATKINANNDAIEAAIENTLSRDGTGPNTMSAVLDMNGQRILNLPNAVANQEPVTLAQAGSIAGVTNPLTQESVAAVLFPRTTAEINAGVTPTNYQYEPGNVLRYGAVGDNSTDCTTAFQNALAANKVVFIPSGSFRVLDFLTVTVNRQIVYGEGLNSSIVFNPTANDRILFSGSNLDNLIYRDFYINANVGTSTGRRGFSFGVTVSRVVWDGVYFDTFNDYCISRDSLQYDKIVNCRFLNTHNPSDTGTAILTTTFANRFTIESCRFASNDRDIRVTTLGHAVTIRDNSFELTGSLATTKTHCIELEGVQASKIDANYFEGIRTGTTEGVIYLTGNTGGVSIDGNFFEGSSGGTTYSNYFLYCTANVRRVTVSNNWMAEILLGFVRASNYRTICHNNRYVDAATELNTYQSVIALMGTETRIDLDLPQTFTFNPADLADGTGETAQVSMTGASFGDSYRVAAPYDLQDLIVGVPYTQSSGVVEFRIQQENAGANVNLASGTWSLYRHCGNE